MRTVLDEALSVFEPLMRLEHELESVAQRIDTQSDMRDELIERQNELQERYQSQGGLTYRSRTRAALIGLGFPEADFTLTCDKLSGGQKSKLSMCKLLLSGALHAGGAARIAVEDGALRVRREEPSIPAAAET